MRPLLLLLTALAALNGAADDGLPTRIPCTSLFGEGMSRGFGRMDGYLVSVVPPRSDRSCNADARHVHLQVRIDGEIYDVAINTDTRFAELDAPLPAGAWSEGWHPGVSLDYVRTFGIHARAFHDETPAVLARTIADELSHANHISVFATGYGPSGGHLVHRNGSGRDGAIVIDPLSARPHVLLFSFEGQRF